MKKEKILKTVLIIIIFVLCIAIIAIWFIQYKTNTYKERKDWKVKKIYIDEVENWNPAIAQELKWDEKTVTQKFYKVEYLNTTYNTSNDFKITSDRIGEKIGNVTATEYDFFTEKYYNEEVSIYKINDFKEDCAIAVQFNESSDYYAYINCHYKPKTLEDLINDLNLKNMISFGTVYYKYKYNNLWGEKKMQNVEFYEVNSSAIWEMLFSDVSMENLYKDSTGLVGFDSDMIGIEVGMPSLGIENRSIIITDRGYLTTNIFETGKGFYIGKEKARYFIDYIIDNYEGYKIVKVYK